jgi:hypothetical protein
MARVPRISTSFQAVALTSLWLAPAAAQEPPSFPSDVELVTVAAVVLDHDGEAVGGLTREDFELRDEGEPRDILSFEALEAPSEPVPVTREERRVSTNEDARPGRVVLASTGGLWLLEPPRFGVTIEEKATRPDP